MVEKFAKLAKSDPRVFSAFLRGSLADGNEDDYSDIDVYYLVDEQSYSDFHSNVRNWLREQGQLVFFDEHSNFGFDLILFVYRNGVKGELGLGTKQNMMSLHAGPYRLLLDKKGLLDGVVFPFQGSLKADELHKYTERELGWYWYWYGVFLSATARGRSWSAITQLQQMRDHMFKLLVVAHNPGRFADRVTRWIPDHVLEGIGKTSLPHYNVPSLLAIAEAMTRILEREIQPLLAATHADYPVELKTTILEKKQQSAENTD